MIRDIKVYLLLGGVRLKLSFLFAAFMLLAIRVLALTFMSML